MRVLSRERMDWSRVTFTQHMTEAAAIVAACQVVLDFGTVEHATYDVQVLRVLKGTGAPFFATGRNREHPDAFRPFGVRLYISVDLASPREIGGLPTFELASMQLPATARAAILAYVKAKTAGTFGHCHRRRRRFATRLAGDGTDKPAIASLARNTR